MSQVYTPSQVAQHNTPEDLWISANGKVYDLSGFLARHPGGRAAFERNAGQDVSDKIGNVPAHQKAWEDIQKYLPKFEIGILTPE